MTFLQKTERELIESQNVKVQQTQAALLSQEHFKPPPERIGGDQNQKRREGRVLFVAEDFLHQGVLEIGMEWT